MMKRYLLFLTVLAMTNIGWSDERLMAPTKEEISAAKKSMAALMSTDMAPDELLKLATEATRSGEKYHLYRQAFLGFARKEDVASAINVLDQYVEAFTNLPNEEVLTLLNSKSAGAIRKDPEISNRIKVLDVKVSAAKQLKTSKRDLKKAPRNSELQCRIGEAEVSLGNWKEALNAFEEAEGKVSRIAKDESIKVNLLECANFWWDYKPITKATLKEFYLKHAADLYKEVLDAGTLSVVEKAIAEKRITQSLDLDVFGESVGDSLDCKDKAIANSRNLIHRWSFNGTLKDSLGSGVDARILGNGTITDKVCNVNLGGIDLCDVAHEFKPDIPFTIEAWYTRNGDTFGSRMILLSSPNKHEVGMTSGGEE